MGNGSGDFPYGGKLLGLEELKLGLVQLFRPLFHLDLQILYPLVDLLVRLLQVPRHTVERLGEVPHLVIRRNRDAVVQVTGCDSPGPLDELSDGPPDQPHEDDGDDRRHGDDGENI